VALLINTQIDDGNTFTVVVSTAPWRCDMVQIHLLMKRMWECACALDQGLFGLSPPRGWQGWAHVTGAKNSSTERNTIKNLNATKLKNGITVNHSFKKYPKFWRKTWWLLLIFERYTIFTHLVSFAWPQQIIWVHKPSICYYDCEMRDAGHLTKVVQSGAILQFDIINPCVKTKIFG